MLILVLDTSNRDVSLRIRQLYKIPKPLGLITAAYIMYDNNFIAATSTNHLVAIGQSKCETLAGENAATYDCPFKSTCTNYSSSLGNIVSIHQRTSEYPNVYILSEDRLWKMNINNCSVQVLKEVSGQVHQSMTLSCSHRLAVDVALENKVKTYSLKTGKVLDKYDFSTFMSDSKIWVSNLDCTRRLEVPFSPSLGNLREYAWVGSQLVYRDQETKRIAQYRNHDLPLQIVFPKTGSSFRSEIDFINMAFGNEEIVAVSHSSNKILLLEEKVWTGNKRATFLPKFRHSCTSPVIHSVPDIEIELCIYMCIKNSKCRTLNYSPSKACSLHSGAELSSTSNESSCYVLY